MSKAVAIFLAFLVLAFEVATVAASDCGKDIKEAEDNATTAGRTKREAVYRSRRNDSIEAARYGFIPTYDNAQTAFFLSRAAKSGGEEETPHIHLASWQWGHVGVYITITLFVVFSGLAKVGSLYARLSNFEMGKGEAGRPLTFMCVL